MYGVPEASTDDIPKMIEKDKIFFDALCIKELELNLGDDVKKMIHVDKKNEDGSPRPMPVKLENEAKKNAIF